MATDSLIATGETLVPQDRNTREPFDRTDHEFPYPDFATDKNVRRLHDRHVFRFPDWTTEIPRLLEGLSAVSARVKDPAPTSKVEPHADGRMQMDSDQQAKKIGALAVLFGKSHEEQDISSYGRSLRERKLEGVWKDARSVIVSIEKTHLQYAKVQMATHKLVRRKQGDGPKAYLERLTRRFRTALEHYYSLRGALQKLDAKLQKWDARCQMHNLSRFQIPRVQKGAYIITIS